MSEFNLNNWIEDVIQSKIEKEVAAMQQAWDQKTQDFLNTVEQKIKVFEQHSREVRITFEENINMKLNEMFNKKAEELILKIEEEVNKKYQIAKEQLTNSTKNKLDDDFEQRIILLMDEKIEAKSEEMSVTFQAQIIKELEQVMAVFQEILNNGLDLDKNIGQELTGKFETFLDSKRDDLDKVLKEKIEQLLNSQENNLEDKLDVKVTAVLEQSLKDRTASLIKDYEDKEATAFEQILTVELNNLQSQNQNNDNNTSLNEHITKLEKMIEKNIKDIEVLNIKLEQIEKLFTMQNSRESGQYPRYIKWDDDVVFITFLKDTDIQNLIKQIKDSRSNGPKVEVGIWKEKLSKMERYVVNRTTRFPSSGLFVKYADVRDLLLLIMDRETLIMNLGELLQSSYNLSRFEKGTGLIWFDEE